jgi:hypothetical protein
MVAGESTGSKIVEGNVVGTGIGARLRRFGTSLAGKLAVIVAILAVVLSFTAWLGLSGMRLETGVQF